MRSTNLNAGDRHLAAAFAGRGGTAGSGRARYVLRWMSLDEDVVKLDEDVVLRRLSQGDAWELGDYLAHPELTGVAVGRTPELGQVLFEVTWAHPSTDRWQAECPILRAALAALRIAASGQFWVEPIDVVASWGSPVQWSGYSEPPTKFDRSGAGRYRLGLPRRSACSSLVAHGDDPGAHHPAL